MDETFSSELSSTIAATLSAFEAQYGHLTASLSGIPDHPWEYTKWEMFGPNHVFPTIDTVTVPTSATTGAMLAEILSKNTTHANLVLAAISREELPTIETIQILSNPFVALSSDNTPYIPENTHRQYVEFLEMINQIDIRSLSAIDNPTVNKVLVDKVLYAALNIGK